MINPGQKGDIVELSIATILRNNNCTIYFPFGNTAKSDLIAEHKNRLYRIQCKFAHISYLENGEIDYAVFKTYTSTRHNDKIQYTKEDIDFFATVINDQGYLIPVEDITSIEQRLRFARPKNNQTKNVTYAENYILENVLQRLNP